MKTEAWYFTDWNFVEVRWQAGQVGYNEGRPNPLSSTQNGFTEIEILSTPAKTEKFEKRPGYRSPTYSLEQVISL